MFLIISNFHLFTLSMRFYLIGIIEASFETMSNSPSCLPKKKKHYPDFSIVSKNIFTLWVFIYKPIKYLELVYMFKTYTNNKNFFHSYFPNIVFFILSNNRKIIHIQNNQTHTQRSSLYFIWLSFICHTKISFNISNKTVLSAGAWVA